MKNRTNYQKQLAQDNKKLRKLDKPVYIPEKEFKPRVKINTSVRMYDDVLQFLDTESKKIKRYNGQYQVFMNDLLTVVKDSPEVLKLILERI